MPTNNGSRTQMSEARHSISDGDLRYRAEVSRKILHVLALGYPVGYFVIGPSAGVPILIALSVLALFLDILRSKSADAHAFFDRVFGFMMRRNERDVLDKGVVINGATWVTVSFTLLVLFFAADIATVSFMLFMFGDAAAALVGRKWGKRYWARAGCTIEGSLAFFGVGLLVAFFLATSMFPLPLFNLNPMALVAGTLTATLLEAAPFRINDNLIAPLGAAASMALVSALL